MKRHAQHHRSSGEHLSKQQWCPISCFDDWESEITVRFCKGESGMGDYVNWCSFLENHLTGSIKLKKIAFPLTQQFYV